MGIQDDIFDVRHTLEKHNEKQMVEAFDEITEYLGKTEYELYALRNITKKIREGYAALELIIKEKQ